METSELDVLYNTMVETDPDHVEFRGVKCQERPIPERKQMFAAVARRYGAGCVQIARYLGCSHSNIICSVNRMLGYMDVYPSMRRRYMELRYEFERRVQGLFLFEQPEPKPPKPKKRPVPRRKSF